MRKFISLFLTITAFYLPLEGNIVKTVQIEDVVQEADQNTLVFFNIAEVLMDTESSLGSQAWRKYIRTRLEPKLHDEITLFVFQNVPPKTPEALTAGVVARLQKKGIPVFAFTSRGRHEWYSSQVPDVDLLTEKLLCQIGIDFSLTKSPFSASQKAPAFGDYFHEGIIYATNSLEKGEVLVQFLEAADLHPSRIIFVDDKADSLATVEAEMKKRGIPMTGFAYSRTSLTHANFDPMIAAIQLDRLISSGKSLSDEEASQIKAKMDPRPDPEAYFRQVIEKWKTRSKEFSLQ